MDINDTSYMDFLKIYFPETASTVAAYKDMSPKGDTPEEIKKKTAEIEEKIKAALNKSECISTYNAYEKIPLAIRTRYSGTKVPEDVMEAAKRDEVLTLREMELHPEIQRAEDARASVREKYGIPPEIVSDAAGLAFLSAVAAGYSEHASARMALLHQQREDLLKKKDMVLANDNLSQAEKDKFFKDWLYKEWIPNKEENLKIATQDRAERMPEKHLIRLLHLYSHGKIDKEELMPQVADLIQKINTNGRQEHFLEYLKQKPIQIKIAHFSKEAVDILANSALQDVPEDVKEQVFSRYNKRHKRAKIDEDAPAERKAQTVAKDISNARTNALPEQRTLTSQERMANMPTTLNRNRGRERQM